MANYGGATPPGGLNNPRKKKKGVNYPGAKKPLYDVPYGSYDPSIDAQLRASRRGLDDLREDTRTAGKWARTDLRQRLGDIARGWGRAKQDINIRARREQQKIGFRRQDLGREATRGREDLASRLQAISRQFAQQGSAQREAANAAGTLHGGTAAAAAQKRAENQAIAEAPIKTAGVRLEEDLATNLNRLAISERQLGSDTSRALTRGRVDVQRDRKLSKRDFGRGQFDRKRKLARGIREQKIGEADLLAQKIDSARQRHPGAFSKYGRKRR